jgi:hypothetical protein
MPTEKFYTAVRNARRMSEAKLGAFRSLLKKLDEQENNVTAKGSKKKRTGKKRAG